MKIFGNVGHDRSFVRLWNIADIFNIQKFLTASKRSWLSKLLHSQYRKKIGCCYLPECWDIFLQYRKRVLCFRGRHSIRQGALEHLQCRYSYEQNTCKVQRIKVKQIRSMSVDESTAIRRKNINNLISVLHHDLISSYNANPSFQLYVKSRTSTCSYGAVLRWHHSRRPSLAFFPSWLDCRVLLAI